MYSTLHRRRNTASNCRSVSVLSSYLNEGPVVRYDFVKLWWPEPLLREAYILALFLMRGQA